MLSMKNKGLIKVVAFLLILALSAGYIVSLYDYPPSNDLRSLNAFPKFEENTIDGVALGTSVVKYGFVPTAAYDKTGVAIALLGTSLQPFGATIPLLKYAKKTQNIKFAVIDIHGLRSAAVKDSIVPAKIQNLYLNIPSRIEGYKMLPDLFDYVERAYDYYGKPESKSQVINRHDTFWYLPFISFHSRWQDGGLSKGDFVSLEPRFLGAYNVKARVFSTTDCSQYLDCWDYEITDIDDFQKNELQLLFDYLKESGIRPLFINMPSFRDKEEQQENASLIAYCKAQGYDAVDFCTTEMLEELSLNTESDFLNRGHLNSKGAVKFSKYLAKYLSENGFSTTSHKGQEGYEIWKSGSKEYKKFYKKGWAAVGAPEE